MGNSLAVQQLRLRTFEVGVPGSMHETGYSGALGCTGMTRGMEWGGRLEGGSGWGTHVHPWLIHVNV